MYKNAEETLKRVFELVDTCPQDYRQKCFEVLLSGYVQAEILALKPVPPSRQAPSEPATMQPNTPRESDVPAAVLPRFKNTAKRIGIAIEKLEGLFDFSVDPFNLHAVVVPGKNAAEKTRQVALLAASRSYLATGAWSADWQEVKSLCVDQNCYDQANHAQNLKKGLSTLFKSVEPGKPVELSSEGVKEADKLLKTLAEDGDRDANK